MGNRLNLDQVNALADGDAEFVRDILQTFRDNAPEMLDQLKEKQGANDMEGTAFYAHKLKSNLRLLGLADAGSVADAIEEGAKAGTDYDFAAGIASLEKELAAALKDLEDLLG